VLVRVAVPVPQLDLLTYEVPESLTPPHVGARVVVPLGPRLVTGIVVERGTRQDVAGQADRIKPIARVLDEGEFVPADVVNLARWTADYYLAGVGATITAVLPPKTRGMRADAHKTRQHFALTAAGGVALERAPDSRSAERQRPVSAKGADALRVLQSAGRGLSTKALGALGVTPGTLRTLVRRGLVAAIDEKVERDPFAPGERVGGDDLEAPQADPARVLTDEQTRALAALETLAAASEFRVALLHGVTGSGKTEVYLRLARRVVAGGRRVLLLVPEIALTPATAAAFRREFGSRVAIQHSGLSDGERHDQWQRIRRSDVDVVIGTRSAVFAPIGNVGLIVVDEEHDTSYKQEEAPRYNGRDIAIVRGRESRALVVLGSATPSLESYARAALGKYQLVTLEQRVLARPLANVRVVDMREEYASDGPDVILSRPLREAIELRLERHEQSLVLLNRRGFATAVFCRQCAATIDCPNCSVSLVIHGEGRRRSARCHYCNHSATIPAACPNCGASYLEQSGFGTERVEAEIARLWPSARVARLDRDAIRRKGSLEAILSRFRRGEIDVLVGTQMIAKGHDFPNVTLVGVISADVGLGMADFRAGERTFQLLTQVAGRAGRGDRPGEAIVQTIYPNHYSIELACRQDYPGFYQREVGFRRHMWYPPRVALISIVVRGTSLSQAMADARGVAQSIERAAGDAGGIRVLGPAPAALTRLRGEYRAQILVKGGDRRRMREAVRHAVSERPVIERRTIVDVDPFSVL
jgi:primosomal protein N' (replication factor Y)